MLDSLPQGIGEHLLSGIQIAGFESLDACGDFCFKRRRQVFLCEGMRGDAEVQQEKDSKAWGSRRTHARARGLRPNTRRGTSGCKSGTLSKSVRAREIGKGGHE